MHLVPRGATFTGYNLQLDTERSLAAQAAPAKKGSASARTVLASTAGAALAKPPAGEPVARRVIASLR